MSLRGVLITCEHPGSREKNVCSGVLFADHWILTLGIILDQGGTNKEHSCDFYEDLLSDNKNGTQISIILPSLHSTFETFKFTAIIENENYTNTSMYVKKPTSVVTYSGLNSPSLVPHKHKKSKLVAMWRCPLVSDAVTTVLSDWQLTPDEKKNDHVDKAFGKLLSTFLLFRIGDDSSKDVTRDDVMGVLGSLGSLTEEPRRGQEIVIESTLFGREFFLNSRSQGIVSNRLGKGGCLLLTDARAGVGCEGGPIFAQGRSTQPALLGLVLSAVSWWKGEWVGFTLGVALQPILSRIQPDDNLSTLPPNIKSIDNLDHIDKSVVLVRCGSDWGTGVLVDASLGIILTCSHVVKKGCPVSVTWRDVTLDASLVYRTRDGVAYDVAILRVTPPPGMQRAVMDADTPVKGEKVFVVGFPLFSSHAHHPTLIPTATSGIIAHVAPPLMLQTTCCVQSGVSGGPVMRENGALLGIVSCNAHDIATGALFPHVNMVVPTMAFATPLRRYCQTLDIKTLWDLEEQDEHVQKMWKLNFTKCKL